MKKYKKQFKPWKKKALPTPGPEPSAIVGPAKADEAPTAIPSGEFTSTVEAFQAVDYGDHVPLAAKDALICMPTGHMSLAEYQAIASRRLVAACEGGDYVKQQRNAILGMVSGLGRLCENLRTNAGKTPSNVVKDTIGEVMWLCASLCTMYGVDLDKVAMHQFENGSEGPK